MLETQRARNLLRVVVRDVGLSMSTPSFRKFDRLDSDESLLLRPLDFKSHMQIIRDRTRTFTASPQARAFYQVEEASSGDSLSPVPVGTG
jgi:hypothetical protein